MAIQNCLTRTLGIEHPILLAPMDIVAAVIVGEGSALIDDIPGAGEIVERVVAEAERLLFRSR